jgi:hypothetical protein
MALEFTLDVSSCPENSRPGMPGVLADRAEAFLKTKFAAGHGHQCKRVTTKPFEERPHLLGHHVVMRRGFFWGFAVKVLPDDFQVRKIKIELVPDSRLEEVAFATMAVLSVLAGIAAAVITNLKSGSFRDRKIVLAFLVTLFAVGGILVVIYLQLSKMLAKSFTDPAKDESEREALWQELLPVLRQP